MSKKGAWAMLGVCLCLCMALCAAAADIVGLPSYLLEYTKASHIFEDEYVYPEKADITFPEKKRNLIYIMLESMENTFASKELGGGLPYNVIPELYDLAQSNINFSHSDGVGGCGQSPGAAWTTGAIVAHTAGVPLKIPSGINLNRDHFDVSMLPGITTISDILHDQGYSYTFMCGSVASYGAREQYFQQHGADQILDFITAGPAGFNSLGYWEWWGLTDYDLFAYAEAQLEELAAKDQPFALTLLTVDTHFPDGRICGLCGVDYEEQFENVLACASYQVSEFLDWLSTQDFYENTAIVVTGDHLTMDDKYIQRALGEEASACHRSVYNCFINSAVEPVNAKNRVFTQMDMFPTTLAAMGVAIPGERLALGTNLFSDKPTLAETYGLGELNQELSRSSAMYRDVFLYSTKTNQQSDAAFR